MEELEARFKSNGGSFKEYRIGDLFEASNGNFDIQKTHINNKGYFVVSSGENNLGIIGKSDIEAKIFEENTITIDMFGNSYFRDFKYKMVTHARVFSLKFKDKNISYKEGLYIIGKLKFLKNIYSYNSMAAWTKVRLNKILLPTTSDNNIDFNFMENYISLLEQERISLLEQYLKVAGLENYILNDEESKSLNDFRENKIKFSEFMIGELFNKIETKKLPYKAQYLPTIKSLNFPLPALTCDNSNNGRKYFVKKENATILKNCISVTANGFGKAFYQDDDFTILQDCYAIDFVKKININKNILYFVGCLNKTLIKYDWGNKSGWNKIKEDKILLPTTSDNNIDFNFMENFINAQIKLCIKGVVEYKDREISATKAIVLS